MSRILVIDDERSLNTLASEYLRLSGHQVTQCYDGESALACLKKEPAYDLIVLDKRLPGLSGWDICRSLKADPALNAIPVILLSASVHPGAEETTGADLSMAKPFSPKELAAAIKRLLNSPA